MKGTSYMTQINLRLPQEMKDELQLHANKQDRSTNWILNKMIADWLKQNQYLLSKEVA